MMVASLRSWATHNAYESVIAHSLRLRGAQVSMLTCGGGLPLCEQGWARKAHPFPCDRCGWFTDRVAAASGLPHERLADGLPWGSDARNAPAEPLASAPGPDPYWGAQLSAPWMMRAAETDASPRGEEMRTDFAVAASGTAAAAEAALDRFRPDTLLLLGGLFAAERTIRELALERRIKVITYEIAARKDSLVFSSEVPAAWSDPGPAWEDGRDRPLTPVQRDAIEGMLHARTEGRGANERYFEDPQDDPERIRAELDIPPGARVVSLFTNLTWDSAVVGRNVAYPGMLAWVADAVESVRGLDDVVLVLRVHPGEARWGTEEPVIDSLGDVPPSVRIVGPERALSSYGLLALSDLVLAYSTTVGLEAAVRGIPVAVAAQTHYRGRGFTHDLGSPEDLRALLRAGSWNATEDQAELALRYAFLFFYRCTVPFPVLPVASGDPGELPGAAALRPGADPYVDFVCDRILDAGDFTLPEELAIPPGTESP